MHCSIARTLEVIGERWALLVLREAFFGTRRFEDFQRYLGIARNVLADRLDALVEHGVLRRVRYQERPERYEYRLTEKGIELNDVVMTLKKWGDRWTASADDIPTLARHADCGDVFEASVMCSACGGPVHARNMSVEPGPGLKGEDLEAWHRRQAARAERRAKASALQQG